MGKSNAKPISDSGSALISVFAELPPEINGRNVVSHKLSEVTGDGLLFAGAPQSIGKAGEEKLPSRERPERDDGVWLWWWLREQERRQRLPVNGGSLAKLGQGWASDRPPTLASPRPSRTGDSAEAKAKLKNFTKTDTVAQSDASNDVTQLALITAEDAPFTFEKFARIRGLAEITFTATIDDGDTGTGEIDENDLTLALDGIDTGLLLNGFRNGATDTQTVSGAPINEAQILAALKADGELAATFVDADVDGTNGNNFLDVPGEFDTTLVLAGKQAGKHKKRGKKR